MIKIFDIISIVMVSVVGILIVAIPFFYVAGKLDGII